MNRKRLDKIKRELAGLRTGRHKASSFQSVASRLGRKLNGKRGKEPMWESESFDDLYPLAIPDHGGGRDISPGVQKQLLNLLEEDVMRWEEVLEAEEQNEAGQDDLSNPGENDDAG